MIDLETVFFADAPFEIIDGDRGKNYPKQSEFNDVGYCLFLSATNVTKSGFEFTSCQFIDQKKDDALNKGKLQRGDIVLTTRGTIGNTAYYSETIPFDNLRINSGMVILRCDPSKLLPAFLYHFVRSPSFFSQVNGLRSGVAQPQLPIRDMRQIKLPLPPLPNQRRIAGILSAYDELIENSQRRIKILESMARGLYREWFVHFRFPGHDSVPRVQSPLGEIPKGWEVKKLGDLITYNRRATTPGPHLAERRYVPIDCIPTKSLALLEAKPIEEAQSSLQLFEKGDILFGAMRPYFHKVVVSPFSGVTRTTCFVFKPVHPGWHAFATMTAFDEATIAHANAHSQGATIPYAVWDGSLSEMPIVLPSTEVTQRFESVVAPILARLAQSFFALGNLRRTRDLLLPRLLSGQIDVEAMAP